MTRNRKRLAGQYNDGMDDMDFLNDIDPSLMDDIRLVKSKSPGKRRKKKANFVIGDQVEVNDTYGTVIYGPYDSNGKDTYEIANEDGEIITAEDDGNSIKIYVAPVEEPEDDDLL